MSITSQVICGLAVTTMLNGGNAKTCDVIEQSALTKPSTILVQDNLPTIDDLLKDNKLLTPSIEIALNNLNIEKELEETKKEKEVSMPHGQVVNLETNLRIRKEPNLNAETIEALYLGMTFDVIGEIDNWYHIKYKGIEGYVDKTFVELYQDKAPHPLYVPPKPKAPAEVNVEGMTAYKAELTAYCNCPECSEGYGSQTAMQTSTRLGVIATPADIPLGSKMYIPALKFLKADGIFYAEDRGGAIKVKGDGTHVIDVWFPSHSQTEKFGRVKTTIYLIK